MCTRGKRTGDIRRGGLLGALALLVVVGLGVTGAMAGETTLQRIKRTGKMVVGNSGVYPPFEFKEAGELVGYDIDLTHVIARKLGVKPEIVVVEFKGIIPALKSGRVDILISGMTYTEGRAKEMAYSESYYNTAMAIATRKDDARVSKKDDLAGKLVGAEMGSTGEREARSVKGVKEVKTYDTPMLAMRDLEIGRLDAVISTRPVIQYMISRSFPKSRIASSYNEGFVGINTRLEDQDFLQEINRILRELKQSGELQALQRKWFGQ
ncbi:MAG: amino acid ABC transporter substrate-binding protein [Deltaproteobacteria bacterium]|nr:amino acid ABC transporter substrate-binding protein [Deltaproteobacteria bacterium]